MRTRPDGRAVATLSRTTSAVLREEEDLSTWTDEELLRGRRRDRRGLFTGKPPKIVPMELVRELVRRRYSRSFAILGHGLEDAAKRVVEITKKKEPTQGDLIALKACEVLFSRVLGKPREHLGADITAEGKPWMQLVAAAIVGREDQVIEGEVVDPADYEDEFVDEYPPPNDTAH